MKKLYKLTISLVLLTFVFVSCSEQPTSQGVTDNEIILGMHTDISGFQIHVPGCWSYSSSRPVPVP